MLEKQCARPGCPGLIRERYPSALKRRTYCRWRCAQWAGVQARLRGTTDVQRAAARILLALGLSGTPSRALIRAVQRIRQRSYQAGWTTVQRKVTRAIKQGVLVRPFKEVRRSDRVA